MISVKCPACGLVDWNVGDCKRCGESLVGLSAEGGEGDGYFPGVSEWAAEARAIRAARLVVTACACVVLCLTVLGALYLAHRPARPQWFWSFYRDEPTVVEIFARNLEATGGPKRIAALRSLKAEGRLALVGGDAAREAAEAGGDYRAVGGVKLPHRLVFKRGEESVTLTLEKYFPNEPVPDSTFVMPE